jgi:hypothetical protein
MIHDFDSDLAQSQARGADDDIWFARYHRLFVGERELVSVRFETDRDRQLQGVDRVLTFADGGTETVDEKERLTDYGDVALEVWSSFERRRPGWIKGTKVCDWIAWVVLPKRRIWLLDYVQLCQLYEVRKRAWADAGYRRIESRNVGYTTVSVCVPRPEILSAVDHKAGGFDI